MEKIEKEEIKPKTATDTSKTATDKSKTATDKPKTATDKPKTATDKSKTATDKPSDTILSAAPEDIKKYSDRLPEKKPHIIQKRDAYYMNNREIFISFINGLLMPYKKELEKAKDTYNCESKAGQEFSLLTHQKIVRDYINLLTPYRGLLLYHGLGSGKTCSSIAITEGIKSQNQVIIMLPASLEVNYKEELKNCGDKLYKKNQYWEFLRAQNPEDIQALSSILSLSTLFIKKQGGAWFVNVKKETNFNKLSFEQQKSLEKQLNLMIYHKYKFIRYNGLRQKKLDKLVEKAGGNPFSNKVIIIDEAHNLISRIVNKLKRPNTLAMQLYEYLKTAENVRIVMLTGTPIINYPNEISIMMNILRGNIKTWTFQLESSGSFKMTEDSLIKLFKSDPKTVNILDYLEYKATPQPTLSITRNPYGFDSSYADDGKYKGVAVSDIGNINDDKFIEEVTRILSEKKIKIVIPSISVNEYTCLPDSRDKFIEKFIEPAGPKKPIMVKNMNLFKRRILGLVSYFPDIDALLPQYNKNDNFKIIMIPMSDFQFSVYEEARVAERKIEDTNAKRRAKQTQGDGASGGDIYEDSVSTYRVFSRAFCNFVFPRPDIVRPLPKEGSQIATAIEELADEELLDALSAEERISLKTGASENLTELAQEEEDELEKQIDPKAVQENENYATRIKRTLAKINEKVNREKYLTPVALETYSPKFLNILSRLLDEQYMGLHLIYSQFRILEGIGILALVLETNGFAQFKIKKESGVWKLNIAEEDMLKPKFMLYTGTEQPDEKEILRNIFNSNWNKVDSSLITDIKTKFRKAEKAKIESENKGMDKVEIEKLKAEIKEIENNYLGDIVKIIMITASGAEGISLSNVRYVHLIEPYWHPVRIDQVIGRARRICSHKNLPTELQTVEVFLYLMEFSEAQLKSDISREAKKMDKSKMYPDKTFTSDQALYEIATQKEIINQGILHNIKEASIDCNIHMKEDSKDKLQCFNIGTTNPNKFAYTPSIDNRNTNTDKDDASNQVIIKRNLRRVMLPGEGQYIVDMTNIKKENEDKDGIIKADIFPLESGSNKNLILLGTLYFKNLKPVRWEWI